MRATLVPDLVQSIKKTVKKEQAMRKMFSTREGHIMIGSALIAVGAVFIVANRRKI
jgi:hypothetical protein